MKELTILTGASRGMGLAIAKALTGLDISNVKFAPEGVTDKQRETAIKAVEYAVAKPFTATSMANE